MIQLMLSSMPLFLMLPMLVVTKFDRLVPAAAGTWKIRSSVSFVYQSIGPGRTAGWRSRSRGRRCRPGRLPLDVGVDRARPDRRDILVAELDLRLVIAEAVGRELQVVGERLVAGLGPGTAELQVGEPASMPLRKPSSESRQPTDIDGKVPQALSEPNRDEPSRRRLNEQQVLVVDVVVQPAEERDQLAVLDVHAVDGICPPR